ncbi:MAG: WG repeat-containing protein [Proteobacteria bacterium]|nr:WG repeat-containing protein [Pseudomonadota bacterium]
MQGPRYYCGYIDLGGAWVIKPQFVSATPFSEGLAAIEADGGRWGFVDKAGNLAIRPQFVSVKRFSDGLAAVEVTKGSWGYIDRKGAITIGPGLETNAAEELSPFRNGLALGSTGDDPYRRKLGVRDKTGKWVVKPEYNDISLSDDGPIVLRLNQGPREAPHVFIVTRTGKPIHAGWFRAAEGGSINFLLVSPDYDDGTRKGKWGLFDPTGKTPLREEFDGVGAISHEYAAVAKGDKWGLIDRKGQFVVPPIYAAVGEFSEGWVGVVKGDGKSTWDAFYVNLKGERLDIEKAAVVPRDIPWLPGQFREGMAAAGGCAGLAYINTTGRIAFPCQPRITGGLAYFRFGIRPAEQLPNPRMELPKTGPTRVLLGYIDKTGRWVIGPFLNVTNRQPVDANLVNFSFYDDRPELPYRYYRHDGTELVPPGVKPRPIVDVRPYLQ